MTISLNVFGGECETDMLAAMLCNDVMTRLLLFLLFY